MSNPKSAKLVEKVHPEARQKAEGVPVSLYPIQDQPKPAKPPKDGAKK